jgi:anti-anti-sigma factor
MQPGQSSAGVRAGARQGQQVLTATGAITLASIPMFQGAVRSAEGTTLIIDLSQVPYIDSAALGVLVQAYVSCQKAGRRLALVGLSHRVKALLQMTTLDILFTTFPTLGEAEQSLV